MDGRRVNGQTLSKLAVHIAWSTKYRYSVLTGDIRKKCRDILMQDSDLEGVNIFKGVVSKDYMHIEYRPSQSISDLVKKLKGRSSRKLQQEFPSLKSRYWGASFLDNRFWLLEYREYYG